MLQSLYPSCSFVFYQSISRLRWLLLSARLSPDDISQSSLRRRTVRAGIVQFAVADTQHKATERRGLVKCRARRVGIHAAAVRRRARFRNLTVLTICISLSSAKRGKCHFPEAGGPFSARSAPCFPPSAINRSRGGGLNWVYLAGNARGAHVYTCGDISTNVSAANRRRSRAGVSKAPTFSLNGEPPRDHREKESVSFYFPLCHGLSIFHTSSR